MTPVTSTEKDQGECRPQLAHASQNTLGSSSSQDAQTSFKSSAHSTVELPHVPGTREAVEPKSNSSQGPETIHDTHDLSVASSPEAQSVHGSLSEETQRAARPKASHATERPGISTQSKEAACTRMSRSRVLTTSDAVEPLVFDAKTRLYIPSRRKLPPTASMRIAAAGDSAGGPLDEARQELLRTQSKLEIVQDQDGRKIVNQYVLFEIVGRGSFGKVRRCVSIHSGSTYACKIMNKKRLKKKRMGRFSTALSAAQKEIAVWKKLRHPNVVSLHDVVDDPASDRLYLVSDFVNGGPLLEPSSGGKWVPLKRIWLRYFMFQLAEALAYLHSFGIAHRDIKPENILVHIESGEASEMRPWRSAVSMESAPIIATAHVETSDVAASGAASVQPAVEADSSDDEAFTTDTPVLQLSPAEMRRIRGSNAGTKADGELASARTPLAKALSSLNGSAAASASARTGEMEALLGVTLKLADFGLAQVFEGDDKTRSTAGTAAFTAPEMVSQEGRASGFSARKADVWALGVTLYMCMFGCTPFSGSTLPELYRAVQEDEPALPPSGWQGELDSAGLDLLQHLLQKSPEQRYTMQQVVQHSFVASSGSLSRKSTMEFKEQGVELAVTEEELQSAITPFAVQIRGLVRAKMATDAVLRTVRHRLHLAKALSSSSDTDSTSPVEHKAGSQHSTLHESEEEGSDEEKEEALVNL